MIRGERSAARLAVRTPAGLVASGFGLGLLPTAPGTWASAATLPLGWLIATTSGPWGLVAASLIVFVIGVIAADRMVNTMATQDPSVIVIDEIAGQLLTLVAAPLSPLAYLVAFLAFRVCDVAKPWPASWADRELSGGFGAMADDMLAGLYALGIVYAFTQFGWL